MELQKKGIIELCKTKENASKTLSLMVEVLKEFASYENAYGSDLDDLLTYYKVEKYRYLWICKVENEIIGTIALDEKTPVSAEIRRFFILPFYRGKGYGKQLFQKCMKQARDNNYAELYLDVSSIQKRALEFYRLKGFTHIGFTDYGSLIFELPLLR